MSPDFWAGYISGAAGILIGNPLDLIKVRLQTSQPPTSPSPSPNTPQITQTSHASQFITAGSLTRGAAAPMLGYGALNALLFVSYNRTSDFLSSRPPFAPSLSINPHPDSTIPTSLWIPWIAGAIGGVATWVVSTPTELIKCRTQLSSPLNSSSPTSTWGITKSILRTEGIRGLYFGGVVTVLRDSIGYGFYFWAYELSTRLMVSKMQPQSIGTSETGNAGFQEAMKVLLCGGLAGVATWASIFPLDVVKTRVQAQAFTPFPETTPLLDGNTQVQRRLGAMDIARNAYRTEGVGVFFRGLGVCSVRAFIVNAAQWAVYEWIMRELDPSRRKVQAGEE